MTTPTAHWRSGDHRLRGGAPVLGFGPFSDSREPAQRVETACYYVADDRPYSLPGTDAPDPTVLSGHTAGGRDAVFNDLNDGANDTFTLKKRDQLLVRTRTSGQWWLVYEATDFHDVEKRSLGGNSEVWGDGPMPGRLLAISCIQPGNPLAPATGNVIVGWSFAGVTDSPVP